MPELLCLSDGLIPSAVRSDANVFVRRRSRFPGARWRRCRFRRSTSDRGQNRLTPAPKPSERSLASDEERRQAIGRFNLARTGLPVAEAKHGHIHHKGEHPQLATLLMAPANLSLADNHDEFLGFIYEYQRRVFLEPPEARGRYRAMSVDLANVTEMTLDGALILTAEYHRLCIARSFRPKIDDASWSAEVRALMEMLGFYSLVDAQARTGGAGSAAGTLRFVKFATSKLVEGQMADHLIEELGEVAGHTPDREAIYAALVEAIMNVTNHAYPEPAVHSVVPPVGHWWAAGAYDPSDGVLEFAVYDQGVGIPATLPRKSFFEAVLTLCPLERSDADLIAGGIEYGRTSTDLPERGNGLWTICRLVEELPGSFVRIVSGKGEVIYTAEGTTEKEEYVNPSCGTLVQWTLKLPAEAQSLIGEVE